MAHVTVDTGAIAAAQRWAERAVADSQDDARAITALLCAVGAASGDAAVEAAGREAGAAWGPSLADGSTALSVLATGLLIAGRTYEVAELESAAGFAGPSGVR